MKERGILFSGPMVRALLAGLKTQTRRVMNPQPLYRSARKFVMPNDVPKRWQDCDNIYSLCPYGQPGDRLWVRETWAQLGDDDGNPTGEIVYRASTTPAPYGLFALPDGRQFEGPWRPSIFMPRKASRLTLEVVRVRIERVQAISEADARAEGVEGRASFERLWHEINGRESWEANPFVWVVDFRRLP